MFDFSATVLLVIIWCIICKYVPNKDMHEAGLQNIPLEIIINIRRKIRKRPAKISIGKITKMKRDTPKRKSKTNQLQLKSIERIAWTGIRKSDLGKKGITTKNIAAGLTNKKLTDDELGTPVNNRKRKLYSINNGYFINENIGINESKTIGLPAFTSTPLKVSPKTRNKYSVFDFTSEDDEDFKQKNIVTRNFPRKIRLSRKSKSDTSSKDNSNNEYKLKIRKRFTRSKPKTQVDNQLATHATELVDERVRVITELINTSLVIESSEEDCNMENEPAHKKPRMEFISDNKESEITQASKTERKVPVKKEKKRSNNTLIMSKSRNDSSSDRSSNVSENNIQVVVLDKFDIHCSKSISTTGSSPIRAHGVSDESPPQVEEIHRRISPRSLETEDFSDDVLDYFNKLKNNFFTSTDNNTIGRLDKSESSSDTDYIGLPTPKNEVPILKSSISPVLFKKLKEKSKSMSFEEGNRLDTVTSSLEKFSNTYRVKAASLPVLSSSKRQSEDQYVNIMKKLELHSVNKSSASCEIQRSSSRDDNLCSRYTQNGTDEATVKDVLANVLEKLNTTLPEIQLNTREALIGALAKTHSHLDRACVQRAEIVKQTAKEIMAACVDLVNGMFTQLETTFQEKDLKLFSDFETITINLMEDNSRKVRELIELVRQDIRAAMRHTPTKDDDD